MKWIKIADQYPPFETMILYSDLKEIETIWVRENGEMNSCARECNDPKCKYIGDSCMCDWIVNPEDYWMLFPEHPIVPEKK